MQIDWPTIQTGRADPSHGTVVDISGWMIPLDPQAHAVDYFLLSAATSPAAGAACRAIR
jgi:membrane dipeptidase